MKLTCQHRDSKKAQNRQNLKPLNLVFQQRTNNLWNDNLTFYQSQGEDHVCVEMKKVWKETQT